VTTLRIRYASENNLGASIYFYINQDALDRSGVCDILMQIISTHTDKTAVLCRAFGAIAFLSKDNDSIREKLLAQKAVDIAVRFLHAYPSNKGLRQVVCYVLLYLYYDCDTALLANLRDSGAIDSQNLVRDLPYDSVLSIWRPNDVVKDLKTQRRNEFSACSLSILSSFILCT
jgi:hypothetical protein